MTSWPPRSSASCADRPTRASPYDPWVKGTYSYYPPGGFTAFGDAQRRQVGRISFAGEHTAPYADRGTMGGAVTSGLRAAREVLGLA